MYYTINIYTKNGTELSMEFDQYQEEEFNKIKTSLDNHNAIISISGATVLFERIESIKIIYAKKQHQEGLIFAELRSYFFN